MNRLDQSMVALLMSALVYALVRWQKSWVMASARLQYLYARMFPWMRSRPWSHRRAYVLQRAMFAVGTSAMLFLALVFWIDVFAKPHATVAAAKATPRAAPPSPRLSEPMSVLWVLLSVLLVTLGGRLLRKRREGAVFVRWLFDTSIPLETPYPRGEAGPVHWGWVFVATLGGGAAMALGVMLVGAALLGW